MLKPLKGYTGALTIVWKPHWGYFQSVEQQTDSSDHVGAVNLRKIYAQEWSTLRSLQLLFGDEEVTVITQDAKAQSPAADVRDGSSRTHGDSAEGQWSAGTPIAQEHCRR